MVVGTVWQRTLKHDFNATGITLHGGDTAVLSLRAAPVDTGIVFRRVDLSPPVEIPAKSSYVGDTRLCTCLVNNGVRIATVEHLLSAMAGLGIDNAYVDVSTAEIPIMDGSASPFVFMIQSAGIIEQHAPKRFIRVKRKIMVTDGLPLNPTMGLKFLLRLILTIPLFATVGNQLPLIFQVLPMLKKLAARGPLVLWQILNICVRKTWLRVAASIMPS
jgi:UDP-3-O-[3-hydroxymyristoyl] N-acetylglucosamine deacetylase